MTRKEGFGPEEIIRAIKETDFQGFNIVRAGHGVSTEVYRMEKEGNVYYLRVAGPGETMHPEMEAHNLCRNKGVLVPEVVYFEEENPDLGRSIIVTAEVKGKPLDEIEQVDSSILVQAGRQLALLNSIPVNGIGCIKIEKGSCGLFANGTTYNDFMLDGTQEKIDRLVGLGLFDKDLANSVGKYLEERSMLMNDYKEGHLAHGDFDTSHIFADGNNFSGIIDLGDIRGASIYHDLAHFFIYSHDNFKALLAGYGEVTRLDSDYRERIESEAVLIALGKLWWEGRKNTSKLTTNRNDFKLIQRVVGLVK